MSLFTTIAKRSRKRRHPRTKLRKILLVAWEGGGKRDASRARNLCRGGVYIDTVEPADVGDLLQLHFDAPYGEVRTRAVVRSMHLGRGMGVEFTGMNFQARRGLHALLKTLQVNEEVEQEAVHA